MSQGEKFGAIMAQLDSLGLPKAWPPASSAP
jgi:hypothetical protein